MRSRKRLADAAGDANTNYMTAKAENDSIQTADAVAREPRKRS